LGDAYSFSGQFDRAIEQYQKVIAENPSFGAAHLDLSIPYFGSHKYGQMIEEYKAYAQLSGDKSYAELAPAMDAAFRSGGWPAAAHKAIDVLIRQRKAGTNYLASYSIADFYADTSDKEHAFEWLNTAYQEHNTFLIFLRTDAALDSLHSDPRYAELVRKIGFPH
jgi:adenylate cyclase